MQTSPIAQAIVPRQRAVFHTSTPAVSKPQAIKPVKTSVQTLPVKPTTSLAANHEAFSYPTYQTLQPILSNPRNEKAITAYQKAASIRGHQEVESLMGGIDQYA